MNYEFIYQNINTSTSNLIHDINLIRVINPLGCISIYYKHFVTTLQSIKVDSQKNELVVQRKEIVFMSKPDHK